MENVKPTTMRSIRIPVLLDKDIIKTAKGVAHGVTGSYLYFLELGLKTHVHYSEIKSDPQRAEKAKDMLDSLLNQTDLVNALSTLPPNTWNALALAVEFKKMDGGKKH